VRDIIVTIPLGVAVGFGNHLTESITAAPMAAALSATGSVFGRRRRPPDR